MRSLSAAIVLALLAGPSPADQAREAWQELFQQSDPPAASRQMQAVLAACGGSAEKVKALIASDDAYADFKPGWHRRKDQVADGATRYELEFVVRVPRQYSPLRSWPLLLAAHGQMGNGAWIGSMMESLLGPAADKYFIVAPTMPGPKVYNAKPYQEQAYLQPMDWARRNLNIDDARVYVSGYSQGGHCSWHLATMFPHLFAAAVPMAGVPAFEGTPYTSYMYLGNLAHLPLWAIWGEKDTAPPPAMGNVDVCRAAAERLRKLNIASFTGTELRGVGHGGCFPPRGQLDRYLESHARQIAPARLAHVFHLPHHARAYYLEAVGLARPPISFDKPLRLEFPAASPPPSRGEVIQAAETQLGRSLYRVSAGLQRPGNSLSVQADGVRTVRLYVTEGMFDLSRPVTIQYWARTWRGTIASSARCLLGHYAATRDAEALVHNEIDLDASGKVTVRFP